MHCCALISIIRRRCRTATPTAAAATITAIAAVFAAVPTVTTVPTATVTIPALPYPSGAPRSAPPPSSSPPSFPLSLRRRCCNRRYRIVVRRTAPPPRRHNPKHSTSRKAQHRGCCPYPARNIFSNTRVRSKRCSASAEPTHKQQKQHVALRTYSRIVK